MLEAALKSKVDVPGEEPVKVSRKLFHRIRALKMHDNRRVTYLSQRFNKPLRQRDAVVCSTQIIRYNVNPSPSFLQKVRL